MSSDVILRWLGDRLGGIIVTGFITGLIAWGATTATVAGHEKRIDKLEKDVPTLAGVAADVSTIKAIVLKRYGPPD